MTKIMGLCGAAKATPLQSQSITSFSATCKGTPFQIEYRDSASFDRPNRHSERVPFRSVQSALIVCLCLSLVLPLVAQDDSDTAQSFSLTSQRTYMPGEKPEVSVYSHNVKSLDFRVYRVNDPVKFFAQMQDLHNFGGQAPRMPKQAHTWLEKFHAWKHGVWAWVRDFVRAQFSPGSRHEIRLWRAGGTEREEGPAGRKATRRCPC